MTKIMVVAGEPSGDLHGASLARELRALVPQMQLIGMGGPRMAEEGVRLVSHCSDAAVIGSVEILGSAGGLIRSFFHLARALREERPDLLVLIDFPDFNLLLARLAWRKRIPIIYYIAPQVWAWRSGRLKTLRRLIDKMLVILPFEEAIYKAQGMDVHFVGHPLLDLVKPSTPRERVRSELGVSGEGTLIALMPGSRRGEVVRHLPRMMKAASLLFQSDPSLSFAISQADSIDDGTFLAILPRDPSPFRIWRGRSYDLINAADLLIVASGTVTLEAGLLGTPMVIIYRLSWFSWALGRMLVRVKQVGLINLILGKTVAPELLQRRASPQEIAQAVRGLLRDPRGREAMKEQLISVKSLLGDAGASRRAALQICHIANSLTPP